MNHQELVVLLKDCYETADFSPIIPFLSPEVKRVSMWYEDITGIDAFVEYLQMKAEMMREHPLSRFHLAKLKYINQQPSFSCIESNHVHPDSHIGDYKPNQKSRFALWYPEDEYVLLNQADIYSEVEVVIRLELNEQGLITCLSLSDVRFYAYEVIDDHQSSDVQLGQIAVDFMNKHYRLLGYETHANIYSIDVFPHLYVQKQNTRSQVVVLVDRYPFTGGVKEDVARFLSMRSYLSNHPIKLVNVQVESLGKHKHRFGLEDNVQCHILALRDAYTPYTEKEST